MSEKRSVVIFGASGFVGSHLTKTLLQSGRRVLALKRAQSNFCFPIQHENLLCADINSAKELAAGADWAKHLEAFFHLAANINVGAAIDSPENFISDNLYLTTKSIQTMRSHWLGKNSIFLSSDRVFGRSTGS